MGYKVGDRFIIEIDSVMTNKHGTLYGIKGFNSLVFDGEGLRRLQKVPCTNEIIVGVIYPIDLYNKGVKDGERITVENIKTNIDKMLREETK